MKKKAKQQIMQKKPKELEGLIAKKRDEIAQAQLKAKEEKNKNAMRTMRRELAIMLSVLRQQQIAAQITGGVTHE